MMQFVEMDNCKSSCIPIKCGVPQGSISGPLLYLIYVNDISNSCNGNMLSFADDTTLHKYILVRPKQKRCDLIKLNIYINNMELNRIGHDCEEKAAKFLGIFIDEYLTWQHHVSHVNSKVARSLFAMKHVKHFIPKNSMKTLYHSLIHSHFSYGLLVWGNASKLIIHSSKILQKRAMRIISKPKYGRII